MIIQKTQAIYIHKRSENTGDVKDGGIKRSMITAGRAEESEGQGFRSKISRFKFSDTSF